LVVAGVANPNLGGLASPETMPLVEDARWSFHRIAVDRKLGGRAASALPTR